MSGYKAPLMEDTKLKNHYSNRRKIQKFLKRRLLTQGEIERLNEELLVNTA